MSRVWLGQLPQPRPWTWPLGKAQTGPWPSPPPGWVSSLWRGPDALHPGAVWWCGRWRSWYLRWLEQLWRHRDRREWVHFDWYNLSTTALRWCERWRSWYLRWLEQLWRHRDRREWVHFDWYKLSTTAETEEGEYSLTEIARPLQLFVDAGVGVADAFGNNNDWRRNVNKLRY